MSKTAPAIPLAGAIIAGGQAARLGGAAKGLLEVGAQRIIDRIAAALVPLVGELFLVSNAADATVWLPGATVIPDILVGAGSAAGVHAALRAAGRPVLAVAWDLPFVTTPLLRLLAARANGGAADAVVPAGAADGELEPLCAWYGPACATAIEAEWPLGDLSLHGLLRRVSTIVVPLNEIAEVAPVDRVFLNVNTRDDLERARRLARMT